MKMCGVAVATMWSYSMEGNPVFMSMNPFSLISTGCVVVVIIYRLFCFILFRFCVFFCFLVFHLILYCNVMKTITTCHFIDS